MSKYETMEDFARKCMWEGGLASFIIEYGVDKQDLGPDLLKFWPLIELVQISYSNLEKALEKLVQISYSNLEKALEKDGFSSYDF